MRTRHLFLAATALLVASCTQNDVILTTPDTDQAVGFKVYTGVQTKGTETTTAEIQKLSKGFGVFAYLHDGAATSTSNYKAYMENTQVTYDGTATAWTYSPVKYWPTNVFTTAGSEKNLLDFYAYAPYNAQGVKFDVATAGTPKLELTLQGADNLKDMPDLVMAEAQKDLHSTASTLSSGKVSFELKHILSKVNMKAKLDKDLSGNGQTKVYITKVELTQTNKLHAKATYNMNTGAWGDYGTNSADYLASPFALMKVMNLTSVKYANYTNIAAIDITANPDGVSLFQTDENLYFIPASSTPDLAAGDVKAKVYYDVVVKANDASTTATTYKVEKEANLPAAGFKKGTSYVYTFIIGLAAIEVNATVSTSWTDSNVNI